MADRDERIIEHLRSIPAALDQAMAAGDSLTEYEARTLVTRARAAVDRFSPPGSAYTQEATMVERSSFHIVWKAEQLCAIVAALRDDYEYGGLESVAELVHADLFDDFLEIADELRSKVSWRPQPLSPAASLRNICASWLTSATSRGLTLRGAQRAQRR